MLRRLSSSSSLNRALTSQCFAFVDPLLGPSCGVSVRKLNRHDFSTSAGPSTTNWVFLGPPGVGKGTYSSRVADVFGMKHISTGDLIRAEVKSGSDLGKEMKAIIEKGHLLPDELMMKVLLQHATGESQQANGVILDGFPRTRSQAEKLNECFDVQLALNMSLREDVLMEKLLGRRICTKCKKNFNVADIYIAAEGSKPEVVMPPLSPPHECTGYMEQRADDTAKVIQERLKIYFKEAAPVEDYFRGQNLLVDFEITSGIPHTLPRLLEALKPFVSSSNPAEMTG